MNKLMNKPVWIVIAILVIGAIIRYGVQYGAKPLADLYPWNWIAMVVTVAVVGYILYRLKRSRML